MWNVGTLELLEVRETAPAGVGATGAQEAPALE